MVTIFTIITSIGVEIQSYSSIAGENEVLLPPGMTFVVKSSVCLYDWTRQNNCDLSAKLKQ